MKWFPWLVVVCTFFLLIAGGMVTSTGSGLAVPDWPLSYGKLMPPMVGGIFYEHGHRMIATLVGALTMVMAILFSRRERRRWVRSLAYVAVGLVIFQGLLGGLTVILLLPTAVSASHATVAQSFFLVAITLAFVQTDWWHRQEGGSLAPRSTAWLALPIIGLFIQLALGALVRHTSSALVVPDFPLAFGAVFPSVSPEALRSYTEELVRRDIWLWADGQIAAGQVILHLAHRYFGMLLGVGLLIHARSLWVLGRSERRFYWLSIAISFLVALQITLGVFTVLALRPAWLATAHQSGGALVLGVTFLSALHLARLQAKSYKTLEITPVKSLITVY